MDGFGVSGFVQLRKMVSIGIEANTKASLIRPQKLHFVLSAKQNSFNFVLFTKQKQRGHWM
jgi:hypothetical protein